MGRFTALIFGALIGAGAALLYSPNSGERNRELVAEKLGGTMKVREWKNIFHANGKQKKAGVAILISGKKYTLK